MPWCAWPEDDADFRVGALLEVFDLFRERDLGERNFDRRELDGIEESRVVDWRR
jgi:hypothetical protein